MLQLRSSDTILSRPHASDRQGGRDQELYQTSLRAHEHVQGIKFPKQNVEVECIEIKHA